MLSFVPWLFSCITEVFTPRILSHCSLVRYFWLGRQVKLGTMYGCHDTPRFLFLLHVAVTHAVDARIAPFLLCLKRGARKYKHARLFGCGQKRIAMNGVYEPKLYTTSSIYCRLVRSGGFSPENWG